MQVNIFDSLYIALIIVFIHCLFWQGMVLFRVKQKYLRHLPWLVRKPLYECVVCMTSLYGIPLHYDNTGFTPDTIFNVLCTGGILLLFSGIVSNADDNNGEQNIKQ